MAYDLSLADKIRQYLGKQPALVVEEKKMFRGITFMVNGKMCVCVSNENLMCRFNPLIQELVATKKGYKPMIMKGREYKGYCYIKPEGIKSQKDFAYFIEICVEFNKHAESFKK